MDKKEVLLRCKDAGFLLNKEMLEFFCGLTYENFEKVFDLVENSGINEKILTKKVFDDKISGKFSFLSKEMDNSVEVLKNFEGKSGKVVNSDFIEYFRGRFEIVRDKLLDKGKVLSNLISIRRLGSSNGVYDVIGMIYSKRFTKNKNLLLEVEDLGGRTVILVNSENKDLFARASMLVEDDVLLFRCSGSSRMLFLRDFEFIGFEKEERRGDEDAWVGFVGDFHVGSRDFLEDDLRRMVSWVNGEVGDARSREIAGKLKYLVVVGDLVEGVGVYPGQEREVLIKSVRGQYNKLGEIFSKLRRDVEVIVVPGLHDAVWLGVPQPRINSKWLGVLSELDNIRFVSNPCVLEMGGLRFFVNYKMEIKSGERELDDVLEKGVLSLVYGEDDFVPENGDDLVLDKDLDVFVSGGMHRAGVLDNKGVLRVWTSCWKGKSDFERRRGLDIDNSRVPVLNLRSREVKVLDFGGGEVVWESGEDLVCSLSKYNNIPHKSEERFTRTSSNTSFPQQSFGEQISVSRSSSCGNLESENG